MGAAENAARVRGVMLARIVTLSSTELHELLFPPVALLHGTKTVIPRVAMTGQAVVRVDATRCRHRGENPRRTIKPNSHTKALNTNVVICDRCHSTDDKRQTLTHDARRSGAHLHADVVDKAAQICMEAGI